MRGERIVAGILASLAGGVLYGSTLQAMGSIQLIALMVNRQSLLVGWGAHLAVTALLGVIWLAFAGQTGGAVRGLIFGAAVWVFAPLIVMPFIMRMPPFMGNHVTPIGLLGHLSYGLVIGLTFRPLLGMVSRLLSNGRREART